MVNLTEKETKTHHRVKKDYNSKVNPFQLNFSVDAPVESKYLDITFDITSHKPKRIHFKYIVVLFLNLYIQVVMWSDTLSIRFG